MKFTLPKALTEQDYYEIVEAASRQMRKWGRGPRGQVINVRDSLDWWVMKETEGRVLASSGRRHCAERQPLIDRLQTLDAAVRKAMTMLAEGGRWNWGEVHDQLEAALANKLTPDEDAA